MAAGLGFKTFTTGEVLTSADVNGYLMQGVLVFASEAARDAAITSPEEGQFAYTKDNNSLWYYTGSVWAASGATGDIEGVTAGTGISGGGTSGTVTITNSMATAIDAKADLVVGTGADTFSVLAVGANGTVLTAASGEATGLQWAAAAAGGKVLQVVSTTKDDTFTSSSAGFVDITGLSVAITPSSATSKILVLFQVNGSQDVGANRAALKLLRDSTTINAGNAVGSRSLGLSNFNAYDDNFVNCIAGSFYDEPATTSSITYKIQLGNIGGGGGTIFINRSTNDTNNDGSLRTASTITVLEIGA